MTVNVIVPVTAKAEEFLQFIQRESGADVHFFVGVREKFQEVFKREIKTIKNAEIHVFSNNTTREEMINSLHNAKMTRGKIIVARRAMNEFEFSALKNSESDITNLQTRHNALFKFIKSIASKVVKKIFAFSFFEDISAICYGENMFDLISVSKNLSTASRVNRFVGVSESSIETSSKTVKKEFGKFKTISLFLLSVFVLLGSLGGGIVILILCNPSAIAVLFIILWFILAVLFFAMGMIGFTRSLVVGDLKIGLGEEFPTVIKSEEEAKEHPRSKTSSQAKKPSTKSKGKTPKSSVKDEEQKKSISKDKKVSTAEAGTSEKKKVVRGTTSTAKTAKSTKDNSKKSNKTE